ncbi:MAG: hypothetical protein PF692_10710 [Kiritimatiellae bacterium]|nr:hypothetical protein [Kiritimatiellia bacterium]
MLKSDKKIIQELANQVAEIAGLPIQGQKRQMWKNLNGLKQTRPMVMIDQVCWNEMNQEELTLSCSNSESREYETRLRKILYQWRHFPVDMVVEPFFKIPMAVQNSGFGIAYDDDIAVGDETNDVVGHKYHNQLVDESDLEKVKMPLVTHDVAETQRRIEVAHELFGDILEIKAGGVEPYLSIWDPISMWMGVEGALYGIIDKPEFIHELCERITVGYLSMLDQMEELGVLSNCQTLIHCTGAYTDELPAAGYNPAKPRTKDMWMFGLAQMFSTVSPSMFEEYEIEYTKRICERFGLVYYGCCDPLDGKMDEVRLLPNVRKVSMSPWANEEVGAEKIGGDYVFSRKPNPAHVGMTKFDADLVRNHLLATREVCDKNGCPLEIILKDISTVCYEPQRLEQWAEIAMEVVGGANESAK